MLNFKKMKLSAKIAILISFMLALIFGIFILITIVLSKNAISESISSEMKVIAENNGLQIQQVFDTASLVAEDLESYLHEAYETGGAQTEAEKARTIPSQIYNINLSQLNYEVEKYIISSVKNSVKNNDDIFGAGAMFEPYKFDNELKGYSIYIDETITDNKVEPFGTFEEYSQEVFYKDAAQSKKTAATDPYDYEGNTLISIAFPIIYENELQGVVMSDISVKNFSRIEMDKSKYSSIFAIVVNNNGTVIYDSRDIENVGQNLADTTGESDFNDISDKMKLGEMFTLEFTEGKNGTKVTSFFSPITVAGETWWSMTAINTAEMGKAVRSTTALLTLLSVISLVVIVLVIVVILRKMLAPIAQVVDAAESISHGNFNIHLKAESEDEIGILTNTFSKTVNMLKGVVSDISNVLNNISNKNLNIETNGEYAGDLNIIKNSLHNIVDTLNNVIGGINQSADQVASGSEQVSTGAQALSQGATEQAGSIQELAATITEISHQVKKNAENAVDASSKVSSVTFEMEKSNEKMHEMISAMNEITVSSQEIGKIIKTIEDIAFQTNILALNATVEAARAGDAGKGFAVVADEVRNLASKSAEASNNTAELIAASIRAVENGSRIANETANSMTVVVEGTEQIVDIINKISEASNQQSESIQQVTEGIDQISSVVQTNSATAEESAATSEELSGQAQILKGMVGEFNLKSQNSNYSTDSNYTYSSQLVYNNKDIDSYNSDNDITIDLTGNKY